MRIDEQQGMARGALGRSYGPHIRALCYQQILEFVVGQIAAQFAYLGVLGSGDGLDFLGPQAAAPIDELVIKSIAIEGQDVPRLKSGDEARLDLGIALKEIIQAIDRGLQQLFGARRGAIILRLRETRNLQGPYQLVIIEGALAVNF